MSPRHHLRTLRRRIRTACDILLKEGPQALLQAVHDLRIQRTAFARHVRSEYLTPAKRLAMEAHIRRFDRHPLISIIMPTFSTPERWLTQAIESVRQQVYPHWELCIADDASPSPELRRLLQEYAQQDCRIRIVQRQENGHISAASNDALALAKGDFIALLDHDDELPPQALYVVAAFLQRHPDADILFSDEDKISEQGKRSAPYFKPGFNYDLLLGQNAVSHLGVYRRQLINDIGGFRRGLEGSQDWDLVLRAIEKTSPHRIVHIPYVLYHWRTIAGSTAQSLDNKSYASTAGQQAIAEHLERTGQKAQLIPIPPGQFQVRFELPSPPPQVSLIIWGQSFDISPCLHSLVQDTPYPSLEVIVLGEPHPGEPTNYPIPIRWLDQPQGNGDTSTRFNQAAAIARGEVLCFLSASFSTDTPGWLEELVAQVSRPGVGAAGPLLQDKNGKVHQAGLVLGWNREIAGSPYRGYVAGSSGYMNHLRLIRNVSALSKDCIAVRKDTYLAVGGMDQQNLPDQYNDIDLSLRISQHGLRLVWSPNARLTLERPTPAPTHRPEAAHYLQQRWSRAISSDPAYNPNQSLRFAWPSMEEHPRQPPFWQLGDIDGNVERNIPR